MCLKKKKQLIAAYPIITINICFGHKWNIVFVFGKFEGVELFLYFHVYAHQMRFYIDYTTSIEIIAVISNSIQKHNIWFKGNCFCFYGRKLKILVTRVAKKLRDA